MLHHIRSVSTFSHLSDRGLNPDTVDLSMGRDTPKYVTPEIQNKNTDPAGQDLMAISSLFGGEVLSNFARPN